jgi:2-keto-4-pentenoate hydratase/2-oxohepta-3-ene-1,7-dioic acid hydratase in catechol pathway
MKIAMYKKKFPILGTVQRLGLFFNESLIIDVNFLWELHFQLQSNANPKNKAQSFAPSDLSEILMNQEEPIDFFQKTLDLFSDVSKKGYLTTATGADIAFDLQDDRSIKFAKPLSHINCYRDFYAHEKHVKKGFEKRGEPVPEQWYQLPVYYKGATTGFIGPEDFIPWPSFTQKLDYELELAAIMGKKIVNGRGSELKKSIFGYTILNDVSARDVQRDEMRVRLGPSKGKDFCSVLGPVVVTADEFNFEDPKLKMVARVNGQEWSQGYSSDSFYSWLEMLEFVARDETIMPTDLMGSGTVGTGCGLEIDQWIKPGDIVELEIEKIGTLKNIVDVPKKYESPYLKK